MYLFNALKDKISQSLCNIKKNEFITNKQERFCICQYRKNKESNSGGQ